jgi:hypothetical protein
MPSQRHDLVIGRLATRSHVTAEPDAAQRIRAALDAALRDRLPRALAQAAEPVLDGLDGVLRVRRIDLALDLDDRTEPAAIAAMLAGRIAAALRRALAREPDQVRWWPHHDAYLADYVAMRLGFRPQSDWPFADLATLTHLPAERAAAELIRGRPQLLGALARLAAETGDVERVVRGWPPAAQAALVIALTRAEPSAVEREASPAALDALAPLAASSPARADPGQLCALALQLAVQGLAGPAHRLPARAVVVAAAGLLAVLTPPPVTTGGLAGTPSVGTDRAGPALARAVSLVGGEAVARAALARVRPLAPGRSTPAAGEGPVGRAADGRPAAGPPAAAGDVALSTPVAGLALLMPSVLALQAFGVLDGTALAQAVWQTLDTPDWEEAAADPALALLYPADPRRIDLAAPQPEPPDDLVARLTDAARAVFAGAPGDRRWSALLLGEFAGRLRGLHGSSPCYLREQFVRRPGAIARDASTVTVRLEPLPLGVVLRMAGHGSPPQSLPHLGRRRLILDLGDGRSR